MNRSKSEELMARAAVRIPGGVNSPVRAFRGVGGEPIFLSKAKGATAYRNYKQLLEDKEIQAVLIATPEHWHHRMILDALAAGKDVYVEKPLCQTPEQGVELMEAEKRSGLPVFFLYRATPRRAYSWRKRERGRPASSARV